MGMTNSSGSPGPTCVDANLTRVVAGEPDRSLLVDKLESDTPMCGARMPPGGQLSAEHLSLVRNWISAGAKND